MSKGLPRFPNFIIIGGVRCGTSNTRRRLEYHPDIYIADRNAQHHEMHYWDGTQGWGRSGLSRYRSRFAPAGERLAGEKTPTHMFSKKAMRRIKRNIPDVKLIMLLRDPVARLWANWNLHNIFRDRAGLRPEPFPHWVVSDGGQQAVRWGDYCHYVRHILRVFPRENVHIIFSELSAAEPVETIRQVHDFLGLERGPAGGTEPRALGATYAKCPNGTKAVYRRMYRASPRRLYHLLEDEHIRTWL